MATRLATRTPAQIFALAFGITYLVVGIVGFAVTAFDGFVSSTQNEELFIFALNPLHNIVHIALGAVWVAAAGKHAIAKTVNLVLGGVLLLVFALGMVGALEWIAIKDAGSPDNYLHLGTAVLAIYFGTVGAAFAGGQ
jgi:hypothetical protein